MKFKQLFAWSALLLATPLFAQVEIVQGMVREMPPGVPNTAAYMTLINHGEDTALVGASCDLAGKTEIHTMLTENGMMKMRRIEKVALPKEKEVKLQQGGDHLMLLAIHHTPKAGQQVTCQLSFENGSRQQVQLPVVAMKAHGTHHNH
ncbi:hypothetical protein SAMN04488540_102389 [Ferrimonas sediminum]|uniref:Copper(I)-binding protein n=1 Tax=Ferrimonas sediminum TaxID=718193 RepID=A0A1G8MK48_9GAMM|nr:copper chaperone PCu(A)C [Ferrimonas sediminum]SDI67690.1 hypothetical protein SAMN04488540_102389 [Ferrimonas sediminum]